MGFLKNNILELRAALIADIDALGYPAYYEDAPTGDIMNPITYPYAVIDLPGSTPDGANTEVVLMYINGWDNSPDTIPLDTMMFNINNLIEKKTYLVAGSSLSMRPELEGKLSLNDPDVDLKRREYRYQVRTMQARL